MTAPHAAAALAEVVVSLGGTILDVRHVGRAAGRSSPWSPWLTRYTAGEGPGAHLPVGFAGCGPSGEFALVEAVAGGVRVGLAAGMTGTVEQDRGETTVASLLAAGRDHVVLAPGAAASLLIGAVLVTIRVEATPPVQRFRAQLDRPLWLTQAGALVLFMVAMFVVQRVEPVGEAPRFDDPDVQARLIRYLTPPQAPETPEAAEASDGPARGAAPVRPRPVVQAPATGGSIAAIVRGLKGQEPSDMSGGAGIFGIAEIARLIKEGAADADASRERFVAMARDDSAFAAEAAKGPRTILTGLGLAVTERLGGGAAGDAVDFDFSWLTPKQSVDPARLAARAARSRFAEREPSPASAPEKRQSVVWTASVGRDLIRGVVNRHKPDVRQCFREGKLRNPELAGEVEVAFTIQSDGAVAYSSVAHSTLNDRETETCVTETVKRWKFPVFVASGGDVDVRFPFTVPA